MKTTIVSTSTSNPVELDALKSYLRIPVGETAEDDFLGALRTVATKRVEDITGRKILFQKWKVYFDQWPCGDRYDSFQIPYPPLRAIPSTGLKYTNSTSGSTTLSSTAWASDTVSEPGRLVLDYNSDWPTETLHNRNPIEITFKCGCASSGGSSTLPEIYKLAIKLLVSHYYENRELAIVGQTINEVPEGVKALLMPYRILNP